MSDAPKTFFGKLGVLTAFLTAVVSILTLMQQCGGSSRGEYETLPKYDLPDAPPPSPSVELGGYCCDLYGNRRCVLATPGPLGGSCFCPAQGQGIACD